MTPTVYANLGSIAEALAETYEAASPFPHLQSDGLFDPVFLDEVLREFPDKAHPDWKTYDAEHEKGKQEGGARMWGPSTQGIMHYLMEDEGWLGFLETLTGIEGLEASSWGGGYHQILEGGRLDLHVDFNKHPEVDLYRRVNVLLFLNRGWESGDGGELVLARRDTSQTVLVGEDGPLAEPPMVYTTVEPAFNRLVVFTTGEDHWHGHPNPWHGSSPRRSLAVYYYTEDPPEGYTGAHSTRWFSDAR